MQIMREADYAIRCLLHLAREPQRVVSATELATATLVPKIFLAKILQRLAKAGLVQSQRGTQGGFKLARAPGEVTLLDAVEAVQGPVALNRCVLTGSNCPLAESEIACPVHPVWVTLSARLVRELGRHSFKKLVQREKQARVRAKGRGGCLTALVTEENNR